MHISSFWLNVFNDANATYTHAYRMQKYIIESNGAAIGKHWDDRSNQSQYVLHKPSTREHLEISRNMLHLLTDIQVIIDFELMLDSGPRVDPGPR